VFFPGYHICAMMFSTAAFSLNSKLPPLSGLQLIESSVAWLI